jgi:hypothetical protein
MKATFKNPVSVNDDHSWHTLAKEAISLSFNDKGDLDPSKSHNYVSSKLLFDKSIKTCKQAWPFLKYADLCEDTQTKINLYKQSILIEKTDFALIKLVYSNMSIDNLEDAKKWLKELVLFFPENLYVKKLSFLEETLLGEDEQFRCSLMPYEFDPQSYLDAHKEPNLRSNLEAIYHFLNYGKNDLVEYRKSIEIPIVQFDLNEIVLFTQYYACDEEKKNNLIYCLNKNIDNNLINKIVIFYDQEELADELSVISRTSKKIHIVKIDKRLTFKEWFDFSKKNYPKSIKLLANSDIYFDSTLSFLCKLEYRKDILYSSSRLDLSTEDKLVRSLTYQGGKQDCWAFRDELIDFEADFVLGSENYSILLRNSCNSSGCNFLNIFKHINCIHVNRNIKIKKRPEFSSI